MSTTGENTKGRRIYSEDGKLHVHLFEPGDFGKHGDTWYGQTPSGLNCNLAGHSIIEHEDGTITASPSILVTGDKEWHGYLEKGVWRSV